MVGIQHMNHSSMFRPDLLHLEVYIISGVNITFYDVKKIKVLTYSNCL